MESSRWDPMDTSVIYPLPSTKYWSGEKAGIHELTRQLGRVPEDGEEVTCGARENEQVPDKVAVAQSSRREERYACRVGDTPR